MSLALFVYLAGVVSDVKFLFFMLSFLLGSAAFFGVMFWTDYTKYHTASVVVTIATVFCAFTAALLPSSKTMYLMAGAYGAQTVYESDTGKRIGKKVTDVIEQQLDGLLEKK